MGRQIAFVFDLNKCLGCQTCSVAFKVLWHQEERGAEIQWWCSVNTVPGRGTPRDWEEMGGGYDDAGNAVVGKLPGPEEFGGPPTTICRTFTGRPRSDGSTCSPRRANPSGP